MDKSNRYFLDFQKIDEDIGEYERQLKDELNYRADLFDKLEELMITKNLNLFKYKIGGFVYYPKDDDNPKQLYYKPRWYSKRRIATTFELTIFIKQILEIEKSKLISLKKKPDEIEPKAEVQTVGQAYSTAVYCENCGHFYRPGDWHMCPL